MLTQLTLKDFAVVSSAELSFERGLTVISGETGAGKSLLVDALLWLTGARADAGIVRQGAERAELSAEFDLSDAPEAISWLRENELNEHDENTVCQLRRVIRADGGSKAWINGRSTTLAQLSELGTLLVEIHGQHEHQALLERGHQLALLDAFGRHEALLEQVRNHAEHWISIEREITAIANASTVNERITYLEHQLAELSQEPLAPSEIEETLTAHRRHSHAATLLTAYDTAVTRLADEESGSLSRVLHQAANELTRHTDSEPRLVEIAGLLSSAQIQIDEAVNSLEKLRDDLDIDARHLEQLEARLSRLHELARKHRVRLEELADKRDQLETELRALHNTNERAKTLFIDRQTAVELWRESACQLSKARLSTGERLSAQVSALMDTLGMAGGTLTIELSAHENGQPSPSGAERCEFLVSANPGQAARALRKVASGGELARISLAIEVATLGLDSVPTMVFDEVDTGIGGAIAEVVGQKLRALGSERQVLCVTHLPQVAAQGHHHFQVSKVVSNNATHSAVHKLDNNARIEELARMLGGIDITDESRANAKQMLIKAQSAPL